MIGYGDKRTVPLSLITVYNFQVEGYHTYFVGKNGITVHNECKQILTNGEAKSIANKLGYQKVKNGVSHGRAVFYNPKAPRNMRYISADLDSHNGGVWKAASSISGLLSRDERTGTFNWDLSERIGD